MVPLRRFRSFHRLLATHPESPSSSQVSTPTKSTSNGETMATMLIGPKQQRFKVNKRLLCATSSFFSERLEDASHSKPISLWLPGESASMFALFVEWVHQGPEFRQYLDDEVTNAQETGDEAAQDIHWAIIRLHLFASHLSLHSLQDLAMDAVQDMYLRCNWDVPPSLIKYLYTECEALAAVRLRRWAVAMVAFSLTSGTNLTFHPQDSATSEPSRFQDLLESLSEFSIDYGMHMRKMRLSGLETRFKNPQLRIPANRLRNEERAFGFRECSFHSHRASVGERRCPHEVDKAKLRHFQPPEEWGRENTGLSAPSRRDKDAIPRPLFSREGDDAYAAKALKHMRSISSTLQT